MDITAVICEYNPFHNGHKIQIEYIKSRFPNTVIVAIMSGNIVQRGELAVAEKYDRAKIALEFGVDAVLELPFPWCSASAGYFAFGGVSIAKKIGANRICFGSECGDIGLLKTCADRLSSDDFEEKLKREIECNTDSAYMSVRTSLYKKLFGEEIPQGANNLLGIEYISKAAEIGYKGEFITYQREENFSATECRKAIKSKDTEALNRLIPSDAELYFSKQNDLASLFLWKIGSSDTDRLASFADIDKTLAAMMKANAEKATSLEKYYSLCTSKKYPRARVARATLNAVLEVTEKDLKSEVLFTVLLACNEKGRVILSENRKNSDIAIITKNADYQKHAKAVSKQYETAHKANRLFSLSDGLERDYVMKKSPTIIK